MSQDRISRDRGSIVYPDYTIRERVADGCIHLVGVAP